MKDLMYDELIKENFKEVRENLFLKKDKFITLRSRCSRCGIFLETKSERLKNHYDIDCSNCNSRKTILFGNVNTRLTGGM